MVSFGHPLSGAVATLGINPSKGEFVDRGGNMLAGADRRLATLASLGAEHHAAVDRRLAARIVDDCATYFERRPYRWFTPLERILRAALGVSYFDATACHLDLVQWATDPVWVGLSEVTRARLLAEDLPFIVRQLRSGHIRVVLVNGRSVAHRVGLAGLTRWREVARLPGRPSAALYVGDTVAPLFVGWSCNLQSQPGALRHTDAITEAVGKLAIPALPRASERETEVEMRPPRGTHARDGSELVALLSAWVAQTRDETLGDASRFGRAPWVSVETPLGLMDLNADTRRSAVEAFLERARRQGGSFELQVVANRRGRLNKVVLDPTAPPLTGWYAYLRHEVLAPTSMTLS